MLDVHCVDDLQQALKFAEQRNLLEQLLERLKYLDTYANRHGCSYDQTTGKNTRCRLYKDFAPYSFAFFMDRRESVDADWQTWFNGGLIYHGQGDSGVGAPTLSVRIGDSSEGWFVHT